MAMVVFGVGCRAPAPAVEAPDLVHHPLHTEIVTTPSGGASARLAVLLSVPEGRRGPHPLVLLNHGSPGSAERARASRPYYRTATKWFAARGWAVAVPSRRGYGRSDGPWAEGFGTCDDPDYVKAGLATAADIGAATRALAGRPEIDGRRIIVVGQSAGGFGALALTARPPPGVIGVINFAGGRGYAGRIGVCQPQRLVAAARRFGQGARIPSLWIYSINDVAFGPDLARSMFAAFREGTEAPARLMILPPYGRNGHALFSASDGPDRWGQHVERFLTGVLSLHDDRPQAQARPSR